MKRVRASTSITKLLFDLQTLLRKITRLLLTLLLIGDISKVQQYARDT
ncbi:MAG: hypothetical protein JWQ02_1698 [Capsulimonas sp.]|nr:hypothetical protein [Capsulimonas sp.]